MNKILEKHSELIRASRDGPLIVKEDFLDLYPEFLKSDSCKQVDKLYKQADADALKQILFVSFVLTRSTAALRKPYEPSSYSVDCLTSLAKFFYTFKTFCKKRRLDSFQFRYASNSIKSGNNKFLNAFAFPSVILCQVAQDRYMDRLLSGLRGTLYKDFPDPFKTPTMSHRIDGLHSSPIYTWYYVGIQSGVSLYMKRISADKIALRLEFDIPFVLPLGKYRESSMTSLLTQFLKTINFGV